MRGCSTGNLKNLSTGLEVQVLFIFLEPTTTGNRGEAKANDVEFMEHTLSRTNDLNKILHILCKVEEYYNIWKQRLVKDQGSLVTWSEERGRII